MLCNHTDTTAQGVIGPHNSNLWPVHTMCYFCGWAYRPSTLIRQKNEAFSKCAASRRDLKTSALLFSVDGKHYENGAFRKRWHHDNHIVSFTEFFSNTNPNWQVVVAFLKFCGVVWKENIWCVFGVKPLFLNSSGGVWNGTMQIKATLLEHSNSKSTFWKPYKFPSPPLPFARKQQNNLSINLSIKKRFRIVAMVFAWQETWYWIGHL